MTPSDGHRPRQRGQALAETGIILLLIVSLSMAIIDFGRMLLLLNMITSATRDAARSASALAYVDRDTDGSPCNEDSIKQIVVDEVANIGLDIDTDDVTISQDAGDVASNTPATITVTTSINIPWIALFTLAGTDLPVERSATFKDESPAGDGCT